MATVLEGMQRTTLEQVEDQIFSSLPSEILDIIFQNLAGKNDLKSLCLVCKSFNQVATPMLYKSVEITGAVIGSPGLGILQRFPTRWPDHSFPSNLRYVRDLTLTTIAGYRTYTRNIDKSCWHKNLSEELDSSCLREKRNLNDDENGITGSGCPCEKCIYKAMGGSSHYENQFRAFCSKLSENALRSFRWELVSCVPESILSSSGYLTQRQQNIEQLSLTTDGYCHAHENRIVYDLSKFGQLRDFTWTGIQSKADFQALRSCLATTEKQLAALKLNVMEWSSADTFWQASNAEFTDSTNRRANFFAQDILGLRKDSVDASHNISFPMLRILHLGQVSFQHFPDGLATSLNFFALRRLSLWNCPGTVELLECLAVSQRDLNLVSFELTYGHEYDPDQAGHQVLAAAVLALLRKMNRLEDLCLSLPVWDCEGMSDFVYDDNTPETLKRVVVHKRALTDPRHDMFPQVVDDVRLDLEMWFAYLTTNTNCEVIGVCLDEHMSDVRDELEGSARYVRIKMLHLRASEDVLDSLCWNWGDVNKLADWAFGPQGLPKLLVFAHGDFAFPETCQLHNSLFCRNESVEKKDGDPNYKVLEPDNRELWDYVQANMDILAACPYRLTMPAEM